MRKLSGGIAFLAPRRGEARAWTVLLLHGIGSNASSFAALATAMPASINVIAWDAPGYGDSAPLADRDADAAGICGCARRKFLDALESTR